MNGFTTQLSVTFLSDNKYVVISPLVFENDKYIVTVLEGFVYNGANIPEELTSMVGCSMEYAMAMSSCIHDALYASNLVSRKEADKIMYRAMISLGKNQLEAIAIYKAVRVFGDIYYRSRENIVESREFVMIELKV